MNPVKANHIVAALTLVAAISITMQDITAKSPNYAASDIISYEERIDVGRKFNSDINSENNLCLWADRMCEADEELTMLASELWQVTQILDDDPRYNNIDYLSSWHYYCKGLFKQYGDAHGLSVEATVDTIVKLADATLSAGSNLDMHTAVSITKAALLYAQIDGYKQLFNRFSRFSDKLAIDKELDTWLDLYSSLCEVNTSAIYIANYGGSIAGIIAGGDTQHIQELRLRCVATDLGQQQPTLPDPSTTLPAEQLFRLSVNELLDHANSFIAGCDFDRTSLLVIYNEATRTRDTRLFPALSRWTEARKAVADIITDDTARVRYLNSTDALLYALADILKSSAHEYDSEAEAE